MSRDIVTPTTSKYSLLDDIEISPTDYESNFQRLRLANEFLLGEFSEVFQLVTDRRALKVAQFLSKLTQEGDHIKKCLLDIDYMPLVQLFVDTLVYCDTYAKQFVAENKFLNDVQEKTSFTQYKSLKIKYHFVAYLIDVVCFYVEMSTKFRVKFHECKGTLALMEYISDETFVVNCLRFNYSPTDHAQVGLNLLESFLRSVYHLSKNADTVINDWDEMNAAVKLMKFSASINRYSYLRMISYMTLANVFRDDDLEMLADTNQVVKDIIKIIKIGAETIVNNKKTKTNQTSSPVKLDQSESESTTTTRSRCEANKTVIYYKENRYNLLEMMDSLYKIAINDEMKYKLYEDFGMKQILKDIIMSGDEFEKEYATRLLYQMCFDLNVCTQFGEDNELVDYLCHEEKVENASRLLKKNIFGILWLNRKLALNSHTEIDEYQTGKETTIEKRDERLLKNRSASDLVYRKVLPPVNEEKKKRKSLVGSKQDRTSSQKVVSIQPEIGIGQAKPSLSNLSRINSQTSISKDVVEAFPLNLSKPAEHIMISYNKESRDVCLRIKNELENEGHRVWIDVEDIHGSSLESMALAIEGSKCVLICMTEKYKQSPNCRAEAEYAFNLRKPIVPLIMQKNYVPDGWLGLILGAKIFINFSKYEFDECMRKLRNEIKNLVWPSTTTTMQIPSIQVNNTTSNNTSNNQDSYARKSLTLSMINQTQTKHPQQQSYEDKREKIRAWSNKDVKMWLNESNTHGEIVKEIENFNGEFMLKLDELIRRNPNYFLDKFSNSKNLDLYSLIKFMNDFEKLFQ